MRLTPLLLAAALLSGCTGSSPQHGLRVVAAENTWGSIAQQIGGSAVSVTSILTDPNADPHLFTSSLTTAAQVSKAQLVIENGLGYDDFADKLVQADGSASKVLDVATAVGASGNPHVWYSPTFVLLAAQSIADRLTALDPAHASSFATNLAAFRTSYQSYVTTLQTLKTKYAGSKVAYTERVPGYLLEAAGLVLGTPASFAQSIEDGNEPSLADTTAMDHAMTGHTVKVLLYNAQVTSPVTAKVQQLAKSSGVPVVGVSETLPTSYSTFQAWQTAQTQALLAALGG